MRLLQGNLKLRESLETVVLDEADLLLSYGYEEDIQTIAAHLPNICQVLIFFKLVAPSCPHI